MTTLRCAAGGPAVSSATKNIYWLHFTSIQMCECKRSANKTMQVLLLCSCSKSGRSSGGVQGSVEAVQVILKEGGEEKTLWIIEWESQSQVSQGKLNMGGRGRKRRLFEQLQSPAVGIMQLMISGWRGYALKLCQSHDCCINKHCFGPRSCWTRLAVLKDLSDHGSRHTLAYNYR